MTKVIGFDLDDTLVPEVLFVKSGIHYIASWLCQRYPVIKPIRVISCMESALLARINHYSALENLLVEYGMQEDVDMKDVVNRFRCHKPDPLIYHLSPHFEALLSRLCSAGCKLVLITDGRSVTQRNKIEAARLYRYFDNDDILISGETGFDKTHPDNFLYVMRKYAGAEEYHYIGDNPQKDFMHPPKLGWKVHRAHPFPLAVHQGIPR
ncbi:MAG: HAD family hydrolase [Muribaculaceae bacterium]|nr:HAD family hydrolase [Muribaculaceae bacterium]